VLREMGGGGVGVQNVEVVEGIEVRRLDCMQCSCEYTSMSMTSTVWTDMCQMPSRDDMKSTGRVNKSTEISLSPYCINTSSTEQDGRRVLLPRIYPRR
jgi:hypothetical protein